MYVYIYISIYIYISRHPETHTRTHALVPIKLKKNQYIQCIKRMNVLKNAQNPLYFHTSEMLNNLYAWFWLLLSIHFIRPGLELRGGDGKRSHRVENCSSRFVPLLLEPVKPESRTRAAVQLQAERLPNSASSHSCASSAPQNCDSRSPVDSRLLASVWMSRHQIWSQ